MSPKVQADAINVPVLIVGGGPAGLTASLLLSRYGIENLVINKYRWTAHNPRAHITNQRTMEVYRDAGIEAQIIQQALPTELMANNVWATSFAGQELARLGSWGNSVERKSDYEKASPSSMCNIAQHVLEPIVANEAMRAGSTMRFNHELLSFSQDDSGVTATVLDRLSGQELCVNAQYMIGADGARSTVMDQLGVSFSGEMGLGHAVNVWLRVDLTAYCEQRPGVLYWMLNPGSDYWVGGGTFICVKPWSEWVMLYMFDPAQGEPDLSEAAVIARARQLIGDASVSIEVLAINQWQINHVVATEYSRGRVLCVGDAVHRHPPANGLGTNTSVQDSYNLAWKLALVLRGQAGSSLLDSYNQERQPVGRQIVDRAMQSVENMLPIAQALGFKAGQSEEQGWQSLHELYADTAEAADRREQLQRAITLQNYQFNCHGVELGQRYNSTAVVLDGSAVPAYPRDPELYYQATTLPGSRLPHAWLLDAKGCQVSTLDICGAGAFTLLTGHGGGLWQQAAELVELQLGVCVQVKRIGLALDYHDAYGDWARQREVDEAGCILVRPDLHIAWRCTSPADIHEQSLMDVMSQVLGR